MLDFVVMDKKEKEKRKNLKRYQQSSPIIIASAPTVRPETRSKKVQKKRRDGIDPIQQTNNTLPVLSRRENSRKDSPT